MVLLSCNQDNKGLGNNKEFQSYIQTDAGFAVVNNNEATPIYLSDNEHSGVIKIAEKFQQDIERVTNVKPNLIVDKEPTEGVAIIVGTIGQSKLIDKLISDKKI